MIDRVIMMKIIKMVPINSIMVSENTRINYFEKNTIKISQFIEVRSNKKILVIEEYNIITLF